MYNKVILIGNLSRDVELKYTPSGTAVAKFGLATNRNYVDNNTKEKKQEVMFIDITVFGRSAEVANQWLKKGKKVLVEGRLVLEQWTDNTGQKRSRHSIAAEKVQFMDNKDENSGAGNYNSGDYQNQASQAKQQPAQPQSQQHIPEVDEEDVPF
jgi:single-strand DNA-binding protein